VVSAILILLAARSITRMRVLGGFLALLSVGLVVQSALAYYGIYSVDGLVVTQRFDEVNVFGVREGFARAQGRGQFSDPNDLAQALIAAGPLLWPFWRSGRTLRNFIVVMLPTAVLIYGVYLTRSRGGILSLLALVALFLRERMTRFRTVGPAVIAGCLALVMLAAGFTGGRSIGGDSSSEGRIDAWYDGFQMLIGNPLFGVGFGRFIEHHVRVAHNSFVHCFAELGLVGYFLWLGMLLAIHTDLYAMRKPPQEEAEEGEEEKGGGEEGQEEEEQEPDEEQTALSRWATAIRFSLYAYLSGAFFLSRTYAIILYLIVGMAIALTDIARSSGRLGPADVPSLVKQTVLGMVGSMVVIYMVVKVSA
jgi:O-antigen ligase